MNIFFKAVLVLFVLSGSAFAQETKENISSEASQPAAADPNAPAPAAPYYIRIPHSERTKGNPLDLMCVSFFKRYEDLEITYGFFEIDSQRKLVFTDFQIKVKRSDAAGTIVIKNVIVGLSEFMSALKSNKVEVSEAAFKNISGKMDLSDGAKGTRHLTLTAEEADLKNITLAMWRSGDSSEKFENAVFGEASARNVVLNLTHPKEKFAVSSVKIKDLVLPKGKADEFTFSSASVNGSEYTDRASFLQAVKKQ